MNTRSRGLYLLAAALTAVSCTVGERREETISREWPAAGIHRVELGEVNGSVGVEAWPSDKVALTAHVRSRGVPPKPDEENKGYFDSRMAGDTLRVGRHDGISLRMPFFRTNDISIDYILRVPPTVALDLKTVNGRITTRGVNAETQATTVNGRIDLETPGAAEVNLRTVNGRVKARFLETFQGASLKTVNGSVEALLPPTASFACDLSQVNGDFEASFPLSIHSHPGSRRVSGEINGGRYELRIVTVNGDIRIDNGAGGINAVPLPKPPPLPELPNLPSPPAPPAPPAPATPTTT